MTAENVFIAGLAEGYNYPVNRFGKHKPFIDLEDCKDIIIVDRSYFLDDIGLIRTWAIARDYENKNNLPVSKTSQLR